MKYLCETCISKPTCNDFCVQHLNFIGMIIRKIRSYPKCKIIKSFVESYPNNYHTIKTALDSYYNIGVTNKNSGNLVVFNRNGKWKRGESVPMF